MDNINKENVENKENIELNKDIMSEDSIKSKPKNDFNELRNSPENEDSQNSVEMYLDSIWKDTVFEIKYGRGFKPISEKQIIIDAERMFMSDFNCCGLRFERKNQYLEHKFMVHDSIAPEEPVKKEEEESFACHLKGCNKVYASSYGLKYHLERGHAKKQDDLIKPHVCPLPNCKKRYKNSNGLKYHMKHGHVKKKKPTI
ncbi:Zinc finger protein [Spraguea lophii 42_110]|uniref:Zinc finger protein n=1 Tax=Spraguea lophii (strain 42_110) TaxID=1358809 RepID=S7WBC9_SPRLO|nr:Zinc finger protein [Spraguea lophii 42_110]